MPPILTRTTRRGFLGGTAAGAALGALALPLRAETRDLPKLDDYRPEYLNPAEWAFVLAATARLIPADGDGPGAIETQVPVFIDRQLAGEFGQAADLYMEGPFVPDADPKLGTQTPLTPAEIYRQGIAAFDKWCSDTKGGAFADLDAQTQDAALTSLSKDEVKLDPKLREFWTLLWQNTQEGYFADPMYGGNAGMAAWVYLGYPGARAAFKEWIGQPQAYPLGPVDIAGERA
jgi:gluconate 2-dehydrogenase gamma chain